MFLIVVICGYAIGQYIAGWDTERWFFASGGAVGMWIATKAYEAARRRKEG
jgi:hypothetical protein